MSPRLLVSFTLCSGLAATVVEAALPPWAEYGHDTLHTGLSGYAGTRVGKLVWSSATVGSAGSAIVTSIALDGAGAAFFGSTDGTLYSVSAATGKTVWSASLGDGISSLGAALSLDGRVVFVSAFNGSYPHLTNALVAVNASTGAPLWSSTPLGGLYGVQSPATVGPDGTVYIASQDISSSTVFAVNGSTGAVRWAVQPGRCQITSAATLSVEHGLLFIASSDGISAGSISRSTPRAGRWCGAWASAGPAAARPS